MDTIQSPAEPADSGPILGCTLSVLILLLVVTFTILGTFSALLNGMFEYHPFISPEFETNLAFVILVTGAGVSILTCTLFWMHNRRTVSIYNRRATNDAVAFALFGQLIPTFLSFVNGILTVEFLNSWLLGTISLTGILLVLYIGSDRPQSKQ
ncbi:MAG TPA: hypothetical protein PLJ47_12580 [Candidatus Hydrogenedentes bacterium]|nr:hypothetical protein [Candidatus Hydrogenedentota bacterium]HRK35424.1 hypothetical protein [Candidatus Hydrogenedentota bacterium]